MSSPDEDDNWRGWLVGAVGNRATVRIDAPVETPGWEERPWVELRALSLREALQRDSIGLRDEYELAPDGRVLGMRRSYDFEAMVRFDLEHCLVDCLLPGEDGCGACVALGGDEVREAAGRDLLDRLGPALADWLLECIEAVNMRRPAEREVLGQAKKA